MKKVKKMLSLTLATLFIVSSLASCSNEKVNKNKDKDNDKSNTNSNTPVNDNKTNTDDTQPEEETESTSEAMIKERFNGVNYEGAEFNILGFSATKHYYSNISPTFVEIWADEYNAEITNDAIRERNLKTMDFLNVTLVPQWSDSPDDISKRIKQAVATSSDDFQAALTSMSRLGPNLQSGELANYMNFDTIDTKSPWWDKNSVDTFTLFGSKLYWLTGDYELCDDYATHVIFFNKDLVQNNGLDLPYDNVLEGKWTYDDYYNMVMPCKKDLNGDGKYVIGVDILPHIGNGDELKHWVYSACEKSIEIDQDGSLTINTLNQRHIDVMDKLYHVAVEGEMIYMGYGDDELKNAFVEDKAVSYCISLALINLFRDMKSDFGILPMPKYDLEQESYGHYISNYVCTALVSPVTVKDRNFVGTVIDTLGAFSTNTVNSALYETLLKSKLVRDQESVKMLEICLSTKYYDWAVDFSWGSTFAGAYNGIYTKKTFNYVSTAQKAQKLQIKNLDKMLDTVRNLQD